MSASVEQFHRDLYLSAQGSAVARGGLTRDAIVEDLMTRLVDAEELQDWHPSRHQGKGRRNRVIEIDAYSDDELELDGSLAVVIADIRDEDTLESLSNTEVTSLSGRVLTFVEESLAGRLHEELEPSTPAADLARKIYEGRSGLRLVRILMLSTAVTGTRFREVERTPLGDVTTELHLWDMNRFFRLAGAGGREEIDIDLRELVPEGLPALSASIGDTGYESYLCVVPGEVLAGLYDRHGSRLLEGNVRSFLTARGTVNKGIRKTILNEPSRFFAFNNGITATATSVEAARVDSHCYLTRVRDLQIVNGGQTTASLFTARFKEKADLSGVFVQLKLSVMPAAVASDLVPLISRYANTQNKVSEADLFANSLFHRKVEELSRRIWAPARPGSVHMTHWFYERARAQYVNEQSKLTPAKLRDFLSQNPKEQLITKTDLAKFENTWAQQPHVVSFGAQKNFLKMAETIQAMFEEHPEEYNERWFQHLVAKAMIFKATEALVSKAPWYAGGYRANTVTYAIAKTVHLVDARRKGSVLDLDRIWQTQSLPDALKQQLLVTAEVVQGILVQPPPQVANVTEWAKKTLCWERVQLASVPVVDGFGNLIRERVEERISRVDARRQGRVDDDLGAMTEVVERAQKLYWKRAAVWNLVKKVVGGDRQQLLQTAASKGAKFVPTDLQAKRLLEIAKKLEEEGYV